MKPLTSHFLGWFVVACFLFVCKCQRALQGRSTRVGPMDLSVCQLEVSICLCCRSGFTFIFTVWLERDSDCKSMLLNSGTGFLLPSYTMSTTSFLEPTREHSLSPLPGSGTVKRLGSRASTRRLFVGFSFDSSLLWGNEQISTQSEAGFCKEFVRCWWFPSWNGWGLLFYQGHGDYSHPTLGILLLQQLEVHTLLPFLCNSKRTTFDILPSSI